MRLIDIEDVALLKTVTDGGLSAKVLWRRINSQPTVDAVPVIRCKDCKHWHCDDSESYCDELGIFDTDTNSYCSYAKRREE